MKGENYTLTRTYTVWVWIILNDAEFICYNLKFIKCFKEK